MDQRGREGKTASIPVTSTGAQGKKTLTVQSTRLQGTGYKEATCAARAREMRLERRSQRDS